MAEAVPAEPRLGAVHARPAFGSVKRAPEVPLLHRLAVVRSDDEAVEAGERNQQLPERWQHRNGPDARLRLRLLERPVLCAGPQHADRAGVEVDLGPLQRAYLADPEWRVSSGEPTPAIPSESSGSPNTRSYFFWAISRVSTSRNWSSASENPPQSIVHTPSRVFSSCEKFASRASSFSAKSSSGPSFSTISTDTGGGTVNGG
jgi:hypothetical protein